MLSTRSDQGLSSWDLSGLEALCPGAAVLGDPIIPLRGVVALDDVNCPGRDLGNTDTIIRRLGDTFGLEDGPVLVPIQLVALHLQSVLPFQVNVGGEAQTWMLDVTIVPTQQPPGVMTIQRNNVDGGTFGVDQLPIRPTLTFTRIDVLPFEIVCQVGTEEVLSGGPGTWSYDAVFGALPGCTSNFFYVGPLALQSGGGGAATALAPGLSLVLQAAAFGPVPLQEATWGHIKAMYAR
jgi:hypothetical protein